MLRMYWPMLHLLLWKREQFKLHPTHHRDKIKVSSSGQRHLKDNWWLMSRITTLSKFISNYLIRPAALQRYSITYTLIYYLGPCSLYHWYNDVPYYHHLIQRQLYSLVSALIWSYNQIKSNWLWITKAKLGFLLPLLSSVNASKQWQMFTY